jgi:hypothetical protein
VGAGDARRLLRSLDRLTRGARNRRRIREELADHLHETAAAERARGLDEGEAEARAVERFGDPVEIAGAFPRSRWPVPAAFLSLAAALAVGIVHLHSQEAATRSCPGTSCPVWMPRPPQHPVEQRIESLTVGMAAALAAALLLAAAARAVQTRRAYRRALEGRRDPRPLTTSALVAQTFRGPIRVALACLATGVLAGAGLAARFATEGPPAPPVPVLPLRPAVLGHHPGEISGVPRARPVLRRILRQMPSDLVSVRVRLGRGLLIRAPGWFEEEGAVSDPSAALEVFEIEMLAGSFAGNEARAGLHVRNWSEPAVMSGRLYADPVPRVEPSDAYLRRQITARLTRRGLHLRSLRITHPYGPLAIAVARSADVRRYLEHGIGALSPQIAWGALVVEDADGKVQAVVTTEYGARFPDLWYDGHLFPTGPVLGSRIPPPAARTPAYVPEAPRA